MLLYNIQYPHSSDCDTAIPLDAADTRIGAVATCVNGDNTDVRVLTADGWQRKVQFWLDGYGNAFRDRASADRSGGPVSQVFDVPPTKIWD